MALFGFAPLLADIGDVIASAAAIIVPIVFVIRTIMAARKQQGVPPVAKPPREVPRRVAPQQPQGQPAEQKKLTDEVEEFLRRAAERRRGGPPREVEILRPEPPAPPKRTAQQPLSRSPRPADVTILTDEERIGREAVATHVQQHLDTRSYANRAEQLTTVDDADENMQEHLHSVFDHQVGNLGQPAKTATAGDDSGEQPADGAVAIGASLAELLSTPQGLRNAFVLQEILRRPDERW